MLLPASLLALLFASPILAVPSTPNDPFHDIAVQLPRPSEPPICCLTPLEPLEPTTDEELLSFEEWKAKQAKERVPRSPPSSNNGQRAGSAGHAEAVPDADHVDTTLSANPGTPSDVLSPEAWDSGATDEHLLPHFRIPVTDRFNYASTDCSARVHTAHRSAKSAYSILNSKKDKYMLSPCAEQKQFVIVELCEDIRIDTVQLANYEFFSGVFKDFSVSVAKTYTTDPNGWAAAGTYRAQNVRGVQSFHPPPSLRDFYRFIRINFHSHYGNEYYCPVSLLRVYGLTHLEEWKWNSWEAESRARQPMEDQQQVSLDLTFSITDSETAAVPGEHYALSASNHSQILSAVTSLDPHTGPATTGKVVPTDNDSALTADSKSLHEVVSADSDISAAIPETNPGVSTKSYEHDVPHDDSSAIRQPPHYSTSVYSNHTEEVYSSSSVNIQDISVAPVSHSVSADVVNTVSHSGRSSAHILSTNSISVSSSSMVQPAQPVATGGESIYRTIMNRLMVLEANTTLYARYVEEHTATVREMLRRLGEDVGRLEGIGKAQAQMYQRSVHDFERYRRRTEVEHIELLSRVSHLTDEVVLEKRLGIAQLCLLLAVLVFMTLTRGSRGEHIHNVGLGRPTSMRDWGRRTLSLTGDWVGKVRSRSPTPQPAMQNSGRSGKTADRDEFEFPSREGLAGEGSYGKTLFPSPSGKRIGSRPRTPSALRISTSRHHNFHSRPVAHASPSVMARPPVQRTSSGGLPGGFGGMAPVPKSAKRWARSAHLHEVKSASPLLVRTPRSGSVDTVRQDDLIPASDSDADNDLFSPPLLPPPHVFMSAKGKAKQQHPDHRHRPSQFPTARPSLPKDLFDAPTVSAPEGDTSEGDGWIDTDAEAPGSDTGLFRTTEIVVN